MSFDPRAFLELGRTFAADGFDEAQYRTAVSRLLYGVFLWAREELHQRKEHVKATSIDDRPFEHSRVRQRFKNGPFKHYAVSQRLGSLYGLRYQSDYDVDSTVGQAEVLQALEYVKYISEAFETMLFAKPPGAE